MTINSHQLPKQAGINEEIQSRGKKVPFVLLRPMTLVAKPGLIIGPVLALALGIYGLNAARADESPSAESMVKAAYLVKFGGYVEWPATSFQEPTSPLVIGIMGSDEIVEVLSRSATSRSVNGRPIVVRKVQHMEPLARLHILFVSRVERQHLAGIWAELKGKGILTVSEDLEAQGVINFVVEDNKVRFDVALPIADEARVKISARLLSVARRVLNRSAS